MYAFQCMFNLLFLKYDRIVCYCSFADSIFYFSIFIFYFIIFTIFILLDCGSFYDAFLEYCPCLFSLNYCFLLIGHFLGKRVLNSLFHAAIDTWSFGVNFMVKDINWFKIWFKSIELKHPSICSSFIVLG